MNCLYHALEAYAAATRRPIKSFETFCDWRKQIQGSDGPVHFSIAPVMLSLLVEGVSVQVETLDWMTPDHWASQAPNQTCWTVCMGRLDLWKTVPALSGGPGIYFLWQAGHAQFAVDIPKHGLPVAAAYLVEGGKRCRITKKRLTSWIRRFRLTSRRHSNGRTSR